MKEYVVHVQHPVRIRLSKNRKTGGMVLASSHASTDPKKIQKVFTDTVAAVEKVFKDNGGKNEAGEVLATMNHCFAISVRASNEAVQKIEKIETVANVHANRQYFVI